MPVRWISSEGVLAFAREEFLRQEASVKASFCRLFDEETRAAYGRLFEHLHSGAEEAVIPASREPWVQRFVNDLLEWLLARVPGTATCTRCSGTYDFSQLRQTDSETESFGMRTTSCPQGHILLTTLTSISY
jgi:hypothetical protein